MPDHFQNRQDAGRHLAAALAPFANTPNLLILALPRGGVPVAAEVAKTLHAPLDLFTVRKLGTPQQPELAFGALATGNIRFLNHPLITRLRIPSEIVEAITRQEAAYRPNQPPLDLHNKTVILIDDGLATGATMRAAAQAVRSQNPSRLIIAVPVAAAETAAAFRRENVADDLICLLTPPHFQAVGQWYDDFDQTSDDEVRALLTPTPATQLLHIPSGNVTLDADLTLPENPRGLVIFAHGSGSSRHSSRNQFVARHLNHAGIATVLMDLLTPGDQLPTHDPRAFIEHLTCHANRISDAGNFLLEYPPTVGLPLALFGASTGAAAALIAAACSPTIIRAVVSRGGRPDLAWAVLPAVESPTLLLVGSADTPVIPLNQQAYDQLRCEKDLQLIPNATHLFEEPGTLEKVATLAADWFTRHLRSIATPPLPPA